MVGNAQAPARREAQNACIFEIAGPVGSGKTTLTQALEEQCQAIALTVPSGPARPGEMVLFAWHALPLLPVLLVGLVSKCLNRQGVKYLFLLSGWNALLRRKVSRSDGLILLQEGPVYMLAWLRYHCPNFARSYATRAWLDHIYNRWSRTLDHVILIDSANKTLIERANVRGVTPTTEELEHWREHYAGVVSELMACHGRTNLVRIDTSLHNVRETTDIVKRTLSL